MHSYPVRSATFLLFFYIFTGVMCLVMAPFLFAPRALCLRIVQLYLWGVYQIEKYILGLDFEMRGGEHLPQDGSYIIAAKHQSAYETLKLHRIFGDPGVILKKELLSIPIWGNFLNKMDMIAIDRSSKDLAMNSIVEGSLRMKAQGRPIIIFPQGTRTAIDASTQDKPYKGGIGRLYEETGLPVIPVALNSGYYWPRKEWLKRPGTVIFEFLEPIALGLTKEDLIKTLEERIEKASDRLLNEARGKY